MVDYYTDIRYTLWELDEILRNIPESYSKRLPEQLKEIISNNKLKNDFIYNTGETLYNQTMSKETRILLAIFYREYWCTEEQKKAFKEQERDYINSKYNPDKLFENKKELNDEEREKKEDLLIKEDIKWYNKILMFIKRIIKR